MAEIKLDGTGVLTGVRQIKARGVAEHVGVGPMLFSLWASERVSEKPPMLSQPVIDDDSKLAAALSSSHVTSP